MSTDRDVTRIVRSWLQDGATVLPDRVLDDVLADLPATPQRRSWWPPRRFANMTPYAKLGIAAAALAVILVAGYNLLPGSNGPGGPSPSPVTTPTPAPTDTPHAPDSGPIEAGSYRLGSSPTFVVDIPDGWFAIGAGAVRKNPESSREVTFDLYAQDIRVFADACQSDGADEPVGPEVADLLAALEEQDDTEVSDAADVTIGDIAAKRFEVASPDGFDATSCDIGGLQIWVDGAGTYLAFGSASRSATVYAADTAAGRLVAVLTHELDASNADLAELDAIVDSIRE